MDSSEKICMWAGISKKDKGYLNYPDCALVHNNDKKLRVGALQLRCT